MEITFAPGQAVPLLAGVIAAVATPGRPLLVAVDGRSGAGKSTLARTLQARLSAAVVEGDDFYAGGDDAMWDAMTAPEKAAHCIDWRRQRPVLEALAAAATASFHPYDWNAFDGTLAAEPVSCHPAGVVVLDGVYSARPELADLFGIRVMLDTPADLRRERLARREGDDLHAAWEARWAEAEDHYFTAVMPPDAFDVVLHELPG